MKSSSSAAKGMSSTLTTTSTTTTMPSVERQRAQTRVLESESENFQELRVLLRRPTLAWPTVLVFVAYVSIWVFSLCLGLGLVFPQHHAHLFL